ncbi:hypothetical protein PM082_006122 [Marasmius tenuissimus]|nr:hypothetical protein PM082_006122 [Marasmius tenuissimus]
MTRTDSEVCEVVQIDELSREELSSDETYEQDTKQPHWRELEVQQLPHNNIPVVFSGLMLLVFLAAMDQTIVATALPTIVEDLGGGDAYAWAGTAYLLSGACLTPLNGKLSDIIGRKILLYFFIVMFLVGSALCGASRTFLVFIISRAIQGIGGGGLNQLMNIILGDIVSLEDRPKYGGVTGAIWGTASVLGPLIGGVLTDRISWRWAFWINLPVGALSAVLLFFLNLNPRPRKSFIQHLREFDFLGLALIMSGVVCLLVGFQFGQSGWERPEAYGLVVAAVVLLFGGCINELYTTKSPVIPPRLFKTRTTTAILGSGSIHMFVFLMVTYFMPAYFQALGSSAVGSGIKMLPFSLVASAVSFTSGQVVAKTGRYRPVMWAGFVLMTLGFGLMIQLDDTSSKAEQGLYIFVAALGAGCFFQIPTVALQACMPIAEMATSTTAFILVRTLSGSIGLSVGNVIFANSLRQRLLEDASDYAGTGRPIGELASELTKLRDIEPPELRRRVIHAYTTSISPMWIVCTPIIFAGLIMVLFIREYSLKRPVARTQTEDTKEDIESRETKVTATV